MSETLHDLIGDFPTLSPEHWRPLAEKALRGAEYDGTLVRRTSDDIARGPVFFDAKTAYLIPPAERQEHLPWGIRQTFTEKSLNDVSKAILGDLDGGVSEIGLVIDSTGRFGISATSDNDWAKLLDGVHLEFAPAFLEPGHSCDAAQFAVSLLALGAKTGGLGLDARHNDVPTLASEFPSFRIVSVDARCVHEAGGSEAQELAYAAAGLACALGRLIEQGITIEQAVSQIETVFAVDADIHLSICKLRAARIVLASIVAAYEGKGLPNIRAVTSGRMLTRQDPWTNMIRLTSAAFAGSVSGADTLTILPPTYALGRPDGLARRVARNLHILLQEESRTGLVADPAAGSYLHENLTRSLAEKAWQNFQAIEADGQFEAIGKGAFAEDVKRSAAALLDRYRTGGATLFGINKYAAPDLREMKFLPGETPPSSDSAFVAINLETAALEGNAS